MKRSLFILTLFAAAVLCGCSKDAPVPEPRSFELASFGVSVEEATKVSSPDGNGDETAAAARVNRCILQIWKDGGIYRTIVKTAPEGTLNFSFRGVVLEKGISYDLLFWADCGDASGGDLYYSTESLANIALISPERSCDDAADAFCNRLLGFSIGDGSSETTLKLRRPLARFDLITRDLPSIAALPLSEGFVPQSASYSYYGCTGFDVREGRPLGDPVRITVTDAAVGGSTTLAGAFVFPPDGESLSTLELTVTASNGSKVSSSFDNIPFKSNWHTSIIGNILTVQGGFSVLLNPLFDGENGQ